MAERGLVIINHVNKPKYILTDNFKPIRDKQGFKTIEFDKLTVGIDFDHRLMIASENSTKDVEQYARYYDLLITHLRNTLYPSGSRTSGRFVALLVAGFCPLYCPPTFFESDSIKDKVMDWCADNDARFYIESQHRVNGPTCKSNNHDIWVSKIDICKALNIKLNEYSHSTVLKEVFLK